MTTFAEFEKAEHDKKVKHFIDYIKSVDHNVQMIDCITMFGICEKDAKPIYEEAKATAMFG